MVFKMGDFITGMGKEFALEAMEISERLSLDKGDKLFNVGDPAQHFYVLVKGGVELSLCSTWCNRYSRRVEPGRPECFFRIGAVPGIC